MGLIQVKLAAPNNITARAISFILQSAALISCVKFGTGIVRLHGSSGEMQSLQFCRQTSLK